MDRDLEQDRAVSGPLTHATTTGVAGALVAYAALPLGDVSDVVSAGIAPAVASLMVGAVSRLHRQMLERRGIVISETIACLDVPIEELFNRIESSESNLLSFGRCLDAADRTTSKQKLLMLGRALANHIEAQGNPDSVDYEPLLMDALLDIDVLHIRVLSAIATTNRRWTNGGNSELEVAREVGLGTERQHALLQPLLRTLERHGLITQTVPGNALEPVFLSGGSDDHTNVWDVTSIGLMLLSRARLEAEVE